MFRVMYVGDERLPEGTDWAIARLDGGRMIAFVKTSKVCPALLSEAWAASTRLTHRLPLQRDGLRQTEWQIPAVVQV